MKLVRHYGEADEPKTVCGLEYGHDWNVVSANGILAGVHAASAADCADCRERIPELLRDEPSRVPIPDGRVMPFELGRDRAVDPPSGPQPFHVMRGIMNSTHPDDADLSRGRATWRGSAWCGLVDYDLVMTCCSPIVMGLGPGPGGYCARCVEAVILAKRLRAVGQGVPVEELKREEAADMTDEEWARVEGQHAAAFACGLRAPESHTAPMRTEVDEVGAEVRRWADKDLAVRVNEVPADCDPPCSVWEVVAEDGGRSWRETYGTTAEVRAFQRGVEAACSLLGVRSPILDGVG